MMEIMPLGPVENAAFNEILGDLEELIRSIDHFRDTASGSKRFDVKYKTERDEIVGINNDQARKKNTNENQWSRVQSRHDCGYPGPGKSVQDNLITKQIEDSSTGTHSELMETRSYNINTARNYCKSADMKLDESAHHDTEESHDTRVITKTSTTSQQALEDTDYLANDAGNMTSRDNNPNSKSITIFPRNNAKSPYRRRSETNEMSIHAKSNKQSIPFHDVSNHTNQEKVELKVRDSEKSFPSRGKVRRADTAPESETAENTLGIEEFKRSEQSRSTHHSRTLSLKRAITRKLKRVKLKPAAGYSVETHHSTEQEDRYNSDRGKTSNDGENNKQSNAATHAATFEGHTEDISYVSGEDIVSQRMGSTLPEAQGTQPEFEDRGLAIDSSSLLCYKKKRWYRKSYQYTKTSNSDGQEHGLKFSSGNESPISPTSESMPEASNHSASQASVANSSAEGCQGSSEPFGNREDPSARRSTIGSSYLRETGKSSPNIYQNNRAGDNATLKPNLHRHSLHVFKECSALSQSKNENRWSTEDRMLKGTSFVAQPPTQDVDKGFKASSIKHKSLFQKSTKSASKAVNMSSIDRNKLTERTWNFADSCAWCNMSGQRVELTEVDLLSLSESECTALQKVAEHRLREIDLGVSISVPKDESKLSRGKHNSSWRGVYLPLVAKNKSKKGPDRVFGIPLFRVVENDQLLRLQTADQDDSTSCGEAFSGNDEDTPAHSSTEGSPKLQRRKSSSQDSSAEHSTASVSSTADGNDHPSTPPNESPLNKRRMPIGRTLKERRPAGYAVISPEEKTLLASLMMTGSNGKNSKQSLLPPTMPQVPYVVQKCCAHILKHGLDVTGIFRIAGAKKRVKQLREEFDHGVDVKIDEDYHAHDVAALLKEFFRDLPEALLTRELYPAFISTAKLSGPQRLSALRCLVWLLPMPNRDTLQELLSFLATVSEHSEDRIDSSGKQICGNKMSVANLSVIFGPNILHREKKTSQSSSEAQYQVQSMERAEESTFVIRIVDDMIRIQRELFLIPRETHDEILRTLQESDPDAVDYLLRRKAANYMKNGGCKTPNSVDGEESPSDTRPKNFPCGEEVGSKEADQSDMNNNKNNNRLTNTLRKSVDRERDELTDTTRSRSIIVGEQMRKISLGCRGGFSVSPRTKEGSISFSDEDLEEILRADTAPARSVATAQHRQDCKEKLPSDAAMTAEINGFASSVEAGLPPKPRPRRFKPVPEQTPNQYIRRQAFSLDPPKGQQYASPEQSPIVNHNQCMETHDHYRHISSPDCENVEEMKYSRQPVSENGTSGFVDMSSEISTNTITYYDDTKTTQQVPFHPRRTGVCVTKFPLGANSFSDTSEEEKALRKRLPSALQLRVNRIHGKDSILPLHSIRIPKTVQSRQSDEGFENSRAVLCGSNGRRLSKDDMYLTLQEFRRRNDRIRNILI